MITYNHNNKYKWFSSIKKIFEKIKICYWQSYKLVITLNHTKREEVDNLQKYIIAQLKIVIGLLRNVLDILENMLAYLEDN